jgi:hypothetical protein
LWFGACQIYWQLKNFSPNIAKQLTEVSMDLLLSAVLKRLQENPVLTY